MINRRQLLLGGAALAAVQFVPCSAIARATITAKECLGLNEAFLRAFDLAVRVEYGALMINDGVVQVEVVE